MAYPFFRIMIKKFLSSDEIKVSLKQETQILLSGTLSVKSVSRTTNPSSEVKQTWRICNKDERQEQSQISRYSALRGKP